MAATISTNPHRDTQSGVISSSAALNKVSWGAIFAGVVIALSVQFLLNLLGVGVGAAVFDPATTDNPTAGTFSISGGVWFVVAGIIAAFVGGYVSSRLSGRPSRSAGSYHGLTTWAVTTIVVLYLLTTSVGSLVGGAFSGLSSVVGGIGKTAATAATTAAPSIANSANPMAGIERQIRGSTGNDPQALQDTAVTAVQAALTGDQAKAEEARTRAAEALARSQNIPVDQARAQVEQYEATYKQNMEAAKQQALEAAQVATKTLSAGAILGFIALLLGAIAGWFGGAAGTKRDIIVETVGTRGV